MRYLRYLTIILALMVAATAFADDGPMFRKNVSKTPELETEHAAIRMLPLYVPAQSSDGTLLTEGIEYYDADGALVETRPEARPLISLYIDGHVEGIEEEGYGGFPGHGERDAYGAVSLDDGDTWKRTNLSKSADRSSFKIKDGKKRVPYPGDVGRTFAASDGNKVLMVWVSRFAGGGNPNYAIEDDAERTALAEYLETTGKITDAGACTDGDLIETPCLYMEDHFGVGGSQGSSDLADEGYPLIGELPYAAVWVARGVIIPTTNDQGIENSTFVWFKAERLTSGRRDANRPEAVCVKGAGCVVTWQEDPDGIRPGHGDGPGEGWSGAIAHHQTDTWYSYIDWDDFDLVSEDDTYGMILGDPAVAGDSLLQWITNDETGSPKAAVPMSIPVRLTDNAMCVAEDDNPYCYVDFDDNGTPDFCADSVSVTADTPEGPDNTINMCITEDGRLMRGNTAATRARLGLHGYSSEGDYSVDPAAHPIDSAWFYVAYEENKGLGDDVCEDGDCLDPLDKRDMGKNVWYHTFDMFEPELVSQGLMLNQPAVYPSGWSDPNNLLVSAPLFGYNFYAFEDDPIYETQGGLESTLYQSEISRRPSQISQDWYDAGPSGTVAFQLWKQGIIRRGGPADIMARRFVMPEAEGQECTTTYIQCSTQEICTPQDDCTTEEVCETEYTCVDNTLTPNPAYNPNRSCSLRPNQLKCYPYLDPNGGPTNELEFCGEVISCEDMTTCETVTTCEDVTTCITTESCDPATNENCEVEEVCTSGFDHLANPYDYANMVCENADGSSAWEFTDGSNPRYVKGLCAAPAINLSANTVLDGETCSDATSCLGAFPFSDYFDDLDMTDSDPISKIYEWEQTGPGFGDTITDPALTNLDDQSWENPYDMAKGHRGYMAGDMIMAMYAWTPNWNDLTNAHSIVNLYVRRSFDGGLTWSTTPAEWDPPVDDTISWTADGTTTCEWMGPISDQYPVCTTYGDGDFEQARNVSQLTGSQVTVLDPRYSPTTRSITEASVSTESLPTGFTAPLYDDDTRDPSRFFMVYETGHTSAYDAGEATPLDLFYSRGVDWGDDYMVWADTLADCAFSEDTPDFCNEFDAIEKSKLSESGEASVTCSPGGQFFYSVWNQWDFDRDGNEIGADAWFRRILFLDGYTIEPPEPGSGDGGEVDSTTSVDTTSSTTTTAVVVKGKRGR